MNQQEINNQIWKTSNSVRGAVDGWDFKQFIFGSLFYKFISHKLDSTLLSKDEAIEKLGYYLEPDFRITQVLDGTNENLSNVLEKVFNQFDCNAVPKLKGLFSDFDPFNSKLGQTLDEKGKRLRIILEGIQNVPMGESSNIDVFGNVYEFMMTMYGKNSGKSGGEYFTPPQASILASKIAMLGQESIQSIYDPTCGSGSLLLQANKLNKNTKIYGQEINHTSKNLAIMNLLVHGKHYNDFDIALGDTLINPHFQDDKPFDVIVSNPPYSVKWIGADDPTMINDDRFIPAGVLAPKGKADLAFVMHSLNFLSDRGRASIICFPGMLYRGHAEQKIREYLVNSNYVDAVINLPENLFYGTTVSVVVLVLSKCKKDNTVQFINASNLFKKEGNKNGMTDEHITKVLKVLQDRKNVDWFSTIVVKEDIEKNDYNLAVSTYVEPEDTREKIDITALNNDIANMVKRRNKKYAELDAFLQETFPDDFECDRKKIKKSNNLELFK